MYFLFHNSIATHCLVKWHEEECHSVVAVKKICSPTAIEDYLPGTMCKVKGFENYKAEIAAVGSEAELNSLLDEHQDDNQLEAVASPPPPKKSKKSNVQNKKKVSQKKKAPCKTPNQQQTRKSKKAIGAILTVSSGLASTTTSDVQPNKTQPSKQASRSGVFICVCVCLFLRVVCT